LREFVELTSPSNETFQKRNIEEASFEVFNEKIIALGVWKQQSY